MCQRFAVRDTRDKLAAYFDVDFPFSECLKNYNVAPKASAPVVFMDEGARTMTDMVWGLETGQTGVRAARIRMHPLFREGFEMRRCLVPASGFYEWQPQWDGKEQPFYVSRKDGLPLAIAGIYSQDAPPRFAIITTSANRDTEVLGGRIPAMIGKEDFASYLEPGPLAEDERHRIFTPPPDGLLQAWPVHRKVASRMRAGSELIKPVPVNS